MHERTDLVRVEPTRPSLAIVIPSRNRPDEIKRCLASIQRQPTLPDEIIVIDQSTVKYALPDSPGLTHLYDPTIGGAAAARNVGIAAASSEVVFFLDDDCELTGDAVREVQKTFVLHSDAVGVQCGIATKAPVSAKFTIHHQIFNHGFFNSAPLRRPNGVQVRGANGTVAYRQSFLKHELFDESLAGYSLGEDWELSKRALKYGSIWATETICVLHHVSPVNRIPAEQLNRLRWKNTLYFYDKLNAQKFFPNRFWRLWWMLGQALMWLRKGMGFPHFGSGLDDSEQIRRPLPPESSPP